MIVFLIYLVGCIAAYLIGKWEWRREFKGEWTIGDRKFILLYSIASWLSVVTIAIRMFLMHALEDNDEAAKW